jgi:hypothetical protein
MSRYWDTTAQRWVYPSTPSDYAAPKWDEDDRVHNWRNYISERLREMWESFTDGQKAAIAESAQEAADREEWD